MYICMTVCVCVVQTVESVMCVLRNLSYQLESEVDLQDGAEDVLDRDWEAEQRRELEELSTRYRTVSCTLPLPLSPPHSLPLPLPPSLSLPLTLSPPPTLPPPHSLPLTLSHPPSLSPSLSLYPTQTKERLHSRVPLNVHETSDLRLTPTLSPCPLLLLLPLR